MPSKTKKYKGIKVEDVPKKVRKYLNDHGMSHVDAPKKVAGWTFPQGSDVDLEIEYDYNTKGGGYAGTCKVYAKQGTKRQLFMSEKWELSTLKAAQPFIDNVL
jgi:hypothetical protein